MLSKVLLRILLFLMLYGCGQGEISNSNDPSNADAVAPVTADKIKTVKVTAPNANLPPFFVVSDRTGLERDIIVQAFGNAGYKTEISYRRGWEAAFMKKQEGIDCITTVNEDEKRVEGFFSDTVVTYQDKAIYLAGKGTEINNVQDMYGMTVEAFPDATEVLPLGDLPDRSRYHEHSSKASQVILLFRGKIDVLIMESSFFDYFRNQVKPLIDDSMAVEKRNLFPPVHYKIACHDESLRDEFNRGLDQLKQKNGIAPLYAKYLNQE